MPRNSVFAPLGYYVAMALIRFDFTPYGCLRLEVWEYIRPLWLGAMPHDDEETGAREA